MTKKQVVTGLAVAALGAVAAVDRWLLADTGTTHTLGMVLAQGLTLISGWLGLTSPGDVSASSSTKQ